MESSVIASPKTASEERKVAGAAGGGPLPIRENSCPFVVQFKVPVLDSGHGEFLNHEFARINANREGSVVCMTKGQVIDRLSSYGGEPQMASFGLLRGSAGECRVDDIEGLFAGDENAPAVELP